MNQTRSILLHRTMHPFFYFFRKIRTVLHSPSGKTKYRAKDIPQISLKCLEMHVFG